MKVLFIGDIIGEPGRKFITKHLMKIKNEHVIDVVIANVENLAGGAGVTRDVLNEIFSSGVNFMTGGNHIWDRKEVKEVIDFKYLLRPANYPENVPGRGWGIYEINNNKFCLINLMGRVYMPLSDCPFQVVDKILSEVSDIKIKIVDFHAEITSEKQAMGWYLDGKVSAVIGTHTHVQTADERILPGGTAYITDCGMVGALNSVIGVEKETVLKKYLTSLPMRFHPAKGTIIFNSVIINIDGKTGKAIEILRFNLKA